MLMVIDTSFQATPDLIRGRPGTSMTYGEIEVPARPAAGRNDERPAMKRAPAAPDHFTTHTITVRRYSLHANRYSLLAIHYSPLTSR
jgi:hypothetical protein